MRVAINTGSKYASSAVSLLIGFFLTPFLLRHLGSDSLGLQVIGMQALQFCMLIGNACSKGCSRFATVQYARRDFKSMNRVLGRAFTLMLVIVAITACLVIVVTVFARELFGLEAQVLSSARWVILIIAAGCIFDQCFGVLESLLFMSQRFYLLDIAQISARILAVTLVVILARSGDLSVVGWVGVSVGAVVILKLLYVMPAALRSVPEARLHLQLPWGPKFKEMAHFSFASLFGTLGFLLYYASSSLVIAHVSSFGIGQVFQYNLGQRWDPQVRDLIMAYAAVLTPVFTTLHATGDTGSLRS